MSSKKKKVIAFTSIRSDYDLMSLIYKKLHKSENIDFQLIVSGAHLSETFGFSVSEIEKSGLNILLKIESLIDSDSKQARLKGAAIQLISTIDIIVKESPDVILLTGDREDVIVSALIGGYLQIPTVHFFGGDHGHGGHIDTPVRHATSKLANVHMVSIEEHKKRLVHMGESPDRIFTIGAPSLDRFLLHQPEEKSTLLKKLGINKANLEYALVIFHPQDVEMEQSALYFERILKALDEIKLFAFVSAPNVDPGNKSILKIIDQYKTNDNFHFYKNLDNNTFLSLYKNAKVQLGNSSAGIIESASIPIPVIDIGLRQAGRKANPNVIFSTTEYEDIRISLNKALSDSFINSIQYIKNLYGDGESSERAVKLIEKLDFKSFLYKTEDPLKLKK